jgi:hypothetical protein
VIKARISRIDITNPFPIRITELVNRSAWISSPLS